MLCVDVSVERSLLDLSFLLGCTDMGAGFRESTSTLYTLYHLGGESAGVPVSLSTQQHPCPWPVLTLAGGRGADGFQPWNVLTVPQALSQWDPSRARDSMGGVSPVYLGKDASLYVPAWPVSGLLL